VPSGEVTHIIYFS